MEPFTRVHRRRRADRPAERRHGPDDSRALPAQGSRRARVRELPVPRRCVQRGRVGEDRVRPEPAPVSRERRSSSPPRTSAAAPRARAAVWALAAYGVPLGDRAEPGRHLHPELLQERPAAGDPARRTSSPICGVSFTRSRAARSRSTSRRNGDGARRRSPCLRGRRVSQGDAPERPGQIGLTLGYEAQIAEFEARHAPRDGLRPSRRPRRGINSQCAPQAVAGWAPPAEARRYSRRTGDGQAHGGVILRTS